VSEAALLTLLAVETGEQQHVLLPEWATQERLEPWLLRSLREIRPGGRPASLEDLRQGLLQGGGKLLGTIEDGRALRRYLLTLHLKRRRILLSSWSRPDAGSPWQRRWLPRPLLVDL
jgi:hypothetical protein